jgi:hypothetical protein
LYNQQPRKEGKNTMTKTEKLLTAITTAVTFETTVPGCNLLIAMRELLSRLQSNDWDSSGYLVDPEELEESFLALFQMWLGVTGYKVPAIDGANVDAPTMDDALTVLCVVSALASQVNTPGVPA